MSLATDILWHAFVTHAKQKPHPKTKPEPVVAKLKPEVTAVSNRGLHMARVPGCQRLAWVNRVKSGIKVRESVNPIKIMVIGLTVVLELAEVSKRAETGLSTDVKRTVMIYPPLFCALTPITFLGRQHVRTQARA